MSDVEKVVRGETRALARAISLVEEHADGSVELLREVFPHTGAATVIGVTGAPGAGKSSLVDRLVASYRAKGRRVGVVAIDPSSAYSGGAILGDRVRMQGHAVDEGVFIRSMAGRGHLGGLASAASDAVDLIDAAGFDPVIVETVGVGQDEIEIARAADVVAVVLVPGMGDDIQAIKAGILEIADVFVVNKADRPGADKVVADLEAMMALATGIAAARPPIFRTVAVTGEGVDALGEGLLGFVTREGADRREGRRRERAEMRFLSVLAERFQRDVRERLLPGARFGEMVREIAERRVDPYTAAERVFREGGVG
ncbi:MAG TPA: methylmalonyl Co-A mutase-associated GTPase MeaB [Candidatus Polarisedimenticolaceae bacterium]|nr:methylmalonyl Co-A mutase-associated GTPase MeaB [Candidatus Polarisedimenticolaceae bacterium]